jgi:DNA mismatch endonuclease, patch repair protein
VAISPQPISEAVRRQMQRDAAGRDTGPELFLRRAIHRRGLRYRVHAAPLKGIRRRADLVFRPSRVAVFVDGCFWHCCPEHGSEPKHNAGYWAEKLARNRDRDRETDELLAANGWLALRFWEHQDLELAAEAVYLAVVERRPASAAALAEA